MESIDESFVKYQVEDSKLDFEAFEFSTHFFSLFRSKSRNFIHEVVKLQKFVYFQVSGKKAFGMFCFGCEPKQRACKVVSGMWTHLQRTKTNYFSGLKFRKQLRYIFLKIINLVFLLKTKVGFYKAMLLDTTKRQKEHFWESFSSRHIQFRCCKKKRKIVWGWDF